MLLMQCLISGENKLNTSLEITQQLGEMHKRGFMNILDEPQANAQTSSPSSTPAQTHKHQGVVPSQKQIDAVS